MSQPSIILGTAGHIDHGKSSLVKVLTGTDPDRLKEEKQRGITIEPGFAQLMLPDETSVGIVDVPGHERFVRQMIAGSSGVDVALLCIAADDGVMPQTVEHMAVLDLLGIPRCIVALTKIDLVDEDWKEFITGEIEAFLTGTPYTAAPIIPFSSKTGEGTAELVEAIQYSAHATHPAYKDKPARLPIDRVFTIKGSGTIVTGTLWQGSIAVDDELEVLPSGKRARVRSAQSHGESRTSVEPSMRVALNLNNLKPDEVHPGDFLITPGSLATADRFDALFSYYDTGKSGKPLVSGSRVHVSHGTREVIGRLLLMDGRTSMKPGDSTYVQIRLDDPLPVARGDRYIVRSYSPVSVIGGGAVLLASPKHRTVLSLRERALLDALAQDDEQAICAAALEIQSAPVQAHDLQHSTGLAETMTESLLDARVQSGSVRKLENQQGTYYILLPLLQKYRAGIQNNLLDFHTKNPLSTGIQKSALLKLCRYTMKQAPFDALLSDLEKQGEVIVSEGEVSHPKAGAGAQVAEQKAQTSLQEAIDVGGTHPPTIDELIAQSGFDPSLAHRALNALEKAGRVVRIGNEFYFSAEAFDTLRTSVRAHLEGQGQASAAELKDAMGISRKYAIPVLEHFDASGFTLRTGDVRSLRG